MMGKSFSLFLGVVGLFLLFSSVFTVQEYEKAIMFKFGEITDTDFPPGLHFKIPFINNIKKYDSRVQTLDARPELFLTSEKKNLAVDSFVMWRIKNLRTYYTSVLGDKNIAESRLDQIIKDKMRGEFSKRTIHQVVSEDRHELMGLLKSGLTITVPEIEDVPQKIPDDDTADEDTADKEVAKTPVKRKRRKNIEDLLGIEIVDIRLKRVDFPPQINASVYARMRSERERIAKELRAQGAEAGEKIRAKADRIRTIIMAKAYQKAEELRGEGDAVAAEAYAAAFGKNQDFYGLYRSLNAYKKAFNQKSDLIVLQPNTEFFKYFKNQNTN